MADVVPRTEGYSYRYDPEAQPSQLLGMSDRGALGFRVLKSGTKSERNQYEDIDSFVFVKKGQVRVLGENDEVLADLSPSDGVTLPANTPFIIEVTGNDDAELVQTFASHVTLTDTFQPFIGSA